MNARKDWLKARNKGLGGSDIGAILGLSPYKTAVDVWLEKTGRSVNDANTLPMRFGTFAEAFVADEYEAATGRQVQRFNAMLQRHDYPFMLANVDRLVIPEGAKVASHKSEIRTDTGLECKTASAFTAKDWGEECSDQMPQSYLVQCAWYMAVTGCAHWDLAALIGNADFRVFNLSRDLDLEDMMIARAREFWEGHVLKDIAPKPVCEADVKALYPKDSGHEIEADSEIAGEVQRIAILDAKIKALETEKDALALSVKKYMLDAAALTWNGQTLATWKAAKDSSKTNWKAIAEYLHAQDEIVRAHTVSVPGARRFLIK